MQGSFCKGVSRCLQVWRFERLHVMLTLQLQNQWTMDVPEVVAAHTAMMPA